MKTTVYSIPSDAVNDLTVVHLSDIHGNYNKKILEQAGAAVPDIIAISGDLDDADRSASDRSISFLRELSAIAPTVYSLGNHEIGLTDSARHRIRSSGVHLLDDSFISLGGISICGLTSGFFHANIGNGLKNPHLFSTPTPDISVIDRFEREAGYKILLCHHPEYYFDYIKDRKIDLVLSGHAHGGQIRLFGRGLMAPGQGLFPRYTSGVHDGRLVISRGLANTAKLIPRLFNETELIILNIGAKKNH